jgi:hypothetical protein
MVGLLLKQLIQFPYVKQIILTLNLPENFEVENHESYQILRNTSPVGFGENHNNAFKFSTQPFFCILNPDIEFIEDPFPELVKCLQNVKTALASPIIISPEYFIEDSARYFPTLSGILRKIFFLNDGMWPLDFNLSLNHPDWVAGMFMLFPSSAYEQIGGFDQNYFLYYEDVDICRRIRNKGYQIALCTQVKVIHNAQRASRKNIKFMFWHLKSLFRFLFLKTK